MFWERPVFLLPRYIVGYTVVLNCVADAGIAVCFRLDCSPRVKDHEWCRCPVVCQGIPVNGILISSGDDEGHIVWDV